MKKTSSNFLLSHLLALFDDIVIVDHQSEDGTAAFLAELASKYLNVQVLNLCEPAYIQSVTMTHIMRDIPSVRRADWVFFLDADEFLPFQSRDCLREALARHHSCPIISIHWQNVIPTRYCAGKFDQVDEKEFLVPSVPSPFHKIAFQPCRFDLEKIVCRTRESCFT